MISAIIIAIYIVISCVFHWFIIIQSLILAEKQQQQPNQTLHYNNRLLWAMIKNRGKKAFKYTLQSAKSHSKHIVFTTNRSDSPSLCVNHKLYHHIIRDVFHQINRAKPVNVNMNETMALQRLCNKWTACFRMICLRAHRRYFYSGNWKWI